MNDQDRAILNAIQSDFPICSRPYQELGRRLGLSEEQVLQTVARLKEEGIIRRIGGNFHSKKLRFASTLCGARVPESEVDRFVKVVNRYPGVTHNYLRDHTYNIWFTFIARAPDEIEAALEAIRQETGVQDILNLPALRTFKIKVDFPL